ncbi:hypothetical protein KUCAC02_036148 [Chaenocephalus aceratus]|nr:hypothetical protein KUCAC02_036148 [Chaenocephalus aceratus]
MHPKEEGFTWFSSDGTRASRIDYILARDSPPTDARLTPVFFSDHAMLSCSLSLSRSVTTGRGLWKLNCSLLEDGELVRQYREHYKEWQTLQDSFDTHAEWWEMLKSRTQTFFKQAEELIHPDQACAVPGRKITDSLLLIRDTICLARDRNFRLVVLNLDFEKAFDRVSHQYLFQEREPVSPVHGLAFGEPSTVWCNVNHPTLTNRLRDMSWMVAHEILPVRSVMHSRGMAANSTCPRPGCGAPETVRHLLWECSAAVDQWAKAGSLRFPCLPAREDLTAQLILYGVSQKQDCSRDFSKQWLTLAAIKDAIWTSRNLLVRRHMQIPPVAVIQMAAATIKSATRHAQDTATKKNRLCAHSDEGAGATRERSKQRRPDSPGGLL